MFIMFGQRSRTPVRDAEMDVDMADILNEEVVIPKVIKLLSFYKNYAKYLVITWDRISKCKCRC